MPPVAVLFVEPLEKLLTEGAAVLNAAEAVRKLVLNRLSEYGLSSDT